MSSNATPQSPFPPGFEPKPASPCADEPDPPRLSILHFLVATAFVAAYLGLIQILQNAHEGFGSVGSLEFYRRLWFLYGIGNGLAIAALLLWPSYHLRGVTFPKHPGEYLLVLHAFGSFLVLLQQGWYIVQEVYQLNNLLGFMSYEISWTIIWGIPIVIANLCAAIRIKLPRWRILFLVFSGLTLIQGFLLCGGAFTNYISFYKIYNILPSCIVAFLVILDHRRGSRYPWTHWLGVAIQFWYLILFIGSLVYAPSP